MKRVLFAALLLSASSGLYAGAISCSAPGTFTFQGLSDTAIAKFTPANGSLSATASACLGAGAFFDWYQVVTLDPLPPGAPPPYIDPQPGGNQVGTAFWRDSLPWYYDTTTPPANIAVCPPGTGFNISCYDSQSWQVSSPCITYKAGQTCPAYPTYTPSSDFLLFSDTPSSASLSLQLAFQTRLVIVSADQTQWSYVNGFSWAWSNLVNPLVGTASSFQALSASALVNPPAARQGGGVGPPFDTPPEAHSSLGSPVSPLFDTPEPSSVMLLGSGLLALGLLARRKVQRG